MTQAEKRLHQLLADILKVAVKQISDETSPKNTDSWDSFNGLMIASELEKTFNISFSLEEVVSVKNVGDIKKTLRNHGIDI